jgi:hypothetical protein
MLSEALQRNANHEARLSNISGFPLWHRSKIDPRWKSLASRTPADALQLRFAQNDIINAD